MRHTLFVAYIAQPVVSYTDPVTLGVDCEACESVAEANRLASAYNQQGTESDVFWSVYGRHADGTVTLLGDFDAENHAKEIVGRITGCEVPESPNGLPLVHSWDDNALTVEPLEARLLAVAREAEAAGHAVTWWSPAEIGTANAEVLIETAVRAGNDFLADNGGGI